jgi:hypothetical protein
VSRSTRAALPPSRVVAIGRPDRPVGAGDVRHRRAGPPTQPRERVATGPAVATGLLVHVAVVGPLDGPGRRRSLARRWWTTLTTGYGSRRLCRTSDGWASSSCSITSTPTASRRRTAGESPSSGPWGHVRHGSDTTSTSSPAARSSATSLRSYRSRRTALPGRRTALVRPSHRRGVAGGGSRRIGCSPRRALAATRCHVRRHGPWCGNTGSGR